MNAQELVVIEKASALSVFTKENALDPYIALVQTEIDKFVPDITSNKGRDAIRSMAAKIAKIKNYVEGVGKELKDEQAKIPKLIDAGRNYAWEKLEAMQKAVRKPLDEWEAAEAARIQSLKDNLDYITRQLPTEAYIIESMPISEIRQRIEKLEAISIDVTWQEFESEAGRAKETALLGLKHTLSSKEKYLAEQAELEKLRKEAAERAEQDRLRKEAEEKAERERLAEEARIEGEHKAAEQARIDAEAKAETDRKAEAERVEQARIALEKDAQAERDAAAAREQKLKDDAAKAEREKAEAEARTARIAKETEERLAAEALEAKRKEEIETTRREANKKHAAKINNEAMKGFIDGGLTEECAKLAVTLIAKKSIPHLSIAY